MLVSEEAVVGIRLQPALLFSEEGGEAVIGLLPWLLLIEECMEVFLFQADYLWIVYGLLPSECFACSF